MGTLAWDDTWAKAAANEAEWDRMTFAKTSVQLAEFALMVKWHLQLGNLQQALDWIGRHHIELGITQWNAYVLGGAHLEAQGMKVNREGVMDLYLEQPVKRTKVRQFLEHEGIHSFPLWPGMFEVDRPHGQTAGHTTNTRITPSQDKAAQIESELHEEQRPAETPSEGENFSRHAALFDPLDTKGLAAMFYHVGDFETWKTFISHANRNGLAEARVNLGRYNPAIVADWLIKHPPRKGQGLSTEHARRVLANNLPERSQHWKSQITGELDY